MAGLWQRLLETLVTSKKAKQRIRTKQRRLLRMESLENRQLMAANITGVAFHDLTDNGVDGADPLLGGVSIALFRDGGNGTFDSGAGDDIAAGTTTSAAVTGAYSLPVTVAGNYFLVQTAASGSLIQRSTARVQSLTVAPADLNSVFVQSIDTFNTTTQTVSVSFPTGPQTSSLAASEAIGGERDLLVSATAGTVSLEADNPSTTNALEVILDPSSNGQRIVSYDGVDGDAGVLNTTGLGGIDLTSGGTAAGVTLAIGSDLTGSNMIVRIHSGGNSSTLTLPIPATSGATPSATLEFPFASFTTATGTGANFTSVGAIEFEVTSLDAADVTVDTIGTYGPTQIVRNIQNLSPMTIGNLVFLDRNNDGLFAGADTGIGGVDLQLFNDLGVIGTFEPGTDTAVTVGDSTATTSSSPGTLGEYSFTGLLPGNYMVVIPSSEFGTGQSLANHLSSPGVTTGDTNNADHGGTIGANGISAAVVLASVTEPINDGDTDANTNLTLDFGFVNATLTLAKTDSPDPVSTGQNLTYTLTATNTGPSNTTNTVITDTLPTGLTFVSGTYAVNGTTALAVNNASGTITTGAFSLSANQSTVMTIIALVGGTFVNGTINTGSVDSDETPAVTANAATALTPNIDLGITKIIVGGATTVGVGGTLTYRLTLTNNSTTTTVTGIEVNDNLPVGFTAGTLPSGVATGTAPADLIWSVASLAPLASTTVDIPINIASNATTGVATNTASIDLPGLVGFNDTVSNNNTASVNITVEPRYDLLVTKGDTLTTVTTGQTLTYTLSINNNGPSAVTNVVVSDTLPASLEFVSATSGGTAIGSATGQAYSATIASIASGATTTILLAARVRSNATGTTIANTASVTADNPSQETGTRPNSATDTDTLTRVVTLNLNKVDSADPVIAGGANFSYLVTAFNSGSADAPNVLFFDPLPTGITFVSGTFAINETTPRSGAVTFNSSTNRLEANLGTLLAGGSASVNRALITINVQAAATAAAGTVTNTGSLTSTDVTTPVTDTEDTTITRNFDVTVTKTENVQSVTSGGTLVYTIIVSNTGVTTATNVGLSDPLPTNTTFVSVTSSSGTFVNTNGTITGTLPTLVQGAPVTVTVTATVNNNTPNATVLTNTATVTAAGESNTNNNTASASATVANVASLRGFVYVDSNKNNVRDTGEAGIPNVTVTITGTINGTAVTRTATTDANGEYVFDNLTPGVYTVTQTQPANFTNGATNPGSTGGTAATNQISTIALNGGVNSVSNNFGETLIFSKRRFLASST
ncbi:MAG: SdrD B-like domain-containing protein [Pirellulaceae bacterium]|nr:SdrD B-like domain-containing protein [Pirellulaceae bacterium]